MSALPKTKTEENEPIPEPTGCMCCGVDTDGFSVCDDCGVQMFLEGNGGNPIKHCKEHNPERFEMIMKWYNQQANKNEPAAQLQKVSGFGG